MEVRIEDHSAEVIAEKNLAVIRALTAMGMQAEGYAKMLAPVDTGRLRNSISHEVVESEDAVYIGTNVEYAPYVELGTRRMKAQPFLKPAVEDHMAEYEQIAKHYLKGE